MRGLSRANRGDPGGIDDLRTSLDLARGSTVPDRRTRHTSTLPGASSPRPRGRTGGGRRRRSPSTVRGARRVRTSLPFASGRSSDWAAGMSSGSVTRWSRRRRHSAIGGPSGTRPHPWRSSLSRRGLAQAAWDICRASSDDAYGTRGLFALALVAPRILRETAEAERMLVDAVVTWEHGDDGFYGCEVAREAVTLRRLDVLERLVALPERGMVSAAHARTTWCAIAAESRGCPGDALDLYRVAAAGWRSFGDPYELAHALFGAGGAASSSLADRVTRSRVSARPARSSSDSAPLRRSLRRTSSSPRLRTLSCDRRPCSQASGEPGLPLLGRGSARASQDRDSSERGPTVAQVRWASPRPVVGRVGGPERDGPSGVGADYQGLREHAPPMRRRPRRPGAHHQNRSITTPSMIALPPSAALTLIVSVPLRVDPHSTRGMIFRLKVRYEYRFTRATSFAFQ